MIKTNFVFKPGKLTTILDAQAGSSGKGKLGSFICEHADNWQFCCNTFMPQAGHWVKLDDGRQFFYQTLNSCAYLHNKFEKLYIAPGATIELPAFFRELEENGIPRRKIGISPVTSILQDIDGGYERGTHDFNGANLVPATLTGNTCVNEHINVAGTIINHKLSRKPLPGLIITVYDTSTDIGVLKVTFGNDGAYESSDTLAADVSIRSGFLDGQNVRIEIDRGVCHEMAFKAKATYDYAASGAGGGPLAATGTTAHGCGANRARRALRRKEAKYARDVPELKEFLCDVPGEIMSRLDGGESGLLEVAQGFQLSYLLSDFFPFTTSRNATVAAGLDDLMIPPAYAGPVILNFRTYPIRINSNKYLDKTTGKHLTWAEVQEMDRLHKEAWHTNNPNPDTHSIQGPELPYRKVEGNSGPGYPDQRETTWEEVTRLSGSTEPITEITSVTKLPRRVFTFSKQNVMDAIRHNRTTDGVYLSVNFMNYVDAGVAGYRGPISGLSDKAISWIMDNFNNLPENRAGCVHFIGTGARTDDTVVSEAVAEISRPGRSAYLCPPCPA